MPKEPEKEVIRVFLLLLALLLVIKAKAKKEEGLVVLLFFSSSSCLSLVGQRSQPTGIGAKLSFRRRSEMTRGGHPNDISHLVTAHNPRR
jgi:hypothetical protein